ncbi:MAG TPA: hypothetical protein VGH81_07455 [Rudaea sp.]|jgi:hypothetical protein
MSTGPTAPANPRYAFVFVCQAGEIEVKALLLAASLKNTLRCQYELIAAVPSPASIWGELSPDTRQQLDAFGVRIVPIENPIDPDYRIGNKLACIDVPTRAGKIVFLDSDILCLRDFGDPASLRVPFAAKPADLRTFAAAAEAWVPLYAAAGVALPRLHLPTTVSGEFGLPYFNSGVIFVDAGLEFGRHWIDCANTIRVTPEMREQRHWLDQISLPIAAHRLGLAYSALDERYNFPAHLEPLPDPVPFFCHYHWPRIVRHEPVLLGAVRALAAAHPAIARVMAREPEWADVLDRALPMPTVQPARQVVVADSATSQILITGIPDSGAKELLQALERSGCRTIDEPAGLAAALASGHVTPHPEAPDAGMVALRCELAFLSPPGAIRHVLPHARAVACVRDPFRAIAAWKTRPHAAMTASIASTMESVRPWLNADPFAQLARIAGLEDAAEQRATWWWWLAQRLLERIDELTIVRFGEESAASAEQARALVAGTHALPTSEVPVPATRASVLDECDRQAIRAICMQAAADLGVADC